MFGFIAVCHDNDPVKTNIATNIDNLMKERLKNYFEIFKNNYITIYAHSNNKKFFKTVAAGNNGVIMGRIFNKALKNDGMNSIESFSDTEVREIISSSGRHLIDKYWGHYVAIIYDKNINGGFALRSPLGSIPLYHFAINGCRIFFSRPADIAYLGIANWEIDWEYLIFHERYHYIETIDSGFCGVRKILHGRVFRFSGKDESIVDLWPLEDLCRPKSYGSAFETAEIFRETLVSCIGAWASCFDRICLRLSGGLDSSIVASSIWLSGATTEVVCYNFFGPTMEGDERAYARAVADKFGYKLIEIADQPTNQRYDLLPIFPLGARPLDEVVSAFRGPTEYPIVESTGSEAVFSGMPGDAIFFQGDVNFAIDYLIERGLDTGFFRAACWAARRSKKSVGSIIFDALKYKFNSYEDIILDGFKKSEAPFLSDDNFSSVENDWRIRHLSAALPGYGPGKKLHGILSTKSPNIFSTGPSGVQYLTLDPLFSQPFYELCLSIPIYDLVWEGWDRGLARLAFSNVLPRSILVREAKGGVETFLEDVFSKNLPLLQEYFADSVLVKHGVLDREKVAKGLVGKSGQGKVARHKFLVTIATEIWVRRWLGYIKFSRSPASLVGSVESDSMTQ